MVSYPSLNPTYLEPDGQEFLPSWLGSGVEIVVDVKTTSTKGGYFRVEKEKDTVQIYVEGITIRQEDYAEKLDLLFTYKEVFKTKDKL